MCGRYTLTAKPEELQERFGVDDLLLQDVPRYNVAPTQPVAVVRLGASGRRELVALKWGLVPRWAKDAKDAARLINARSETAGEKPSFKEALAQRRCLVLADGFFEWQKLSPKEKQPYRFVVDGGKPFAFAGLWERARIDGQPLETCTILTTEANDVVRPLHDRMPVILDDDAQIAAWLDPATRDVQALLDPLPAERVSTYAVDRRVGSPKFDEPACVERL
jgi:putative SOS response-associated peptidase YedK